MAQTDTFIYTNGSDPNATWTDPTNAWNSDDTTYAYKSISKNTDDSSNYLVFSSNNSSDQGYNIGKVEIGIKHYVSFSNLETNMQVSVDSYTTSYTRTVPAGTEEIYYWDITSEKASWSWSDIANLDVHIWADNNASGARTLRVYELYIRVTQANPKLYYRKSGVTYSCDFYPNIDPRWEKSFGTYLDGSKFYAQLTTNTAGASASDFMVRDDSTTFAVMTVSAGGLYI